MRILKSICVILIATVFLSSCDNQLDEMTDKSEVNVLLDSENYQRLINLGYEFDKEDISFERVNGKIVFNLPISKSSSAQRTGFVQSDVVVVGEESQNSGGEIVGFQDVAVLSYEEQPNDNYTGIVQVEGVYSQDEIITYVFENGELFDMSFSGDESDSDDNEPTCNSLREVAACAGYRIDNYNWVELVAFTAGFPGSLATEMASCVVDGCPYEKSYT